MRQNSSCFRENVLTYLSTRIFVKSDCGDSSYVKLPKSVILGKIFPSILCKHCLLKSSCVFLDIKFKEIQVTFLRYQTDD